MRVSCTLRICSWSALYLSRKDPSSRRSGLWILRPHPILRAENKRTIVLIPPYVTLADRRQASLTLIPLSRMYLGRMYFNRPEHRNPTNRHAYPTMSAFPRTPSRTLRLRHAFSCPSVCIISRLRYCNFPDTDGLTTLDDWNNTIRTGSTQ